MMSDPGDGSSLDALAAKGRAARVAEDTKNAERRAKLESTQTEATRRQAAWRLSPMAVSPLRFIFSIPFFVVWGVTVAMAFPYFRYFINGGHAVHGTGKGGTSWVLDPHKDGYGLFYGFVVTTTVLVIGIVWRILAKGAGRRAFAAESAWAQASPIPVLGYPGGIGDDEHRFKISIFFTGDMPERGTLADVLRGVDDCIKADGHDSQELLFEADYPRDDAPARNAQRFAASLHVLVDVLAKVHAQTPIERIEIH